MVRIVVEQDKFLRMLPVIFDPATPPEHQRAVADFFAHDEPDFAGWCRRLRERMPGLVPAEIAFARDQADLRDKLATAGGVIVESFTIGEAELAAAPRLAIVQKFGALTHNIDRAACARRGVAVGTVRRRVNVAVAEQAFALMMALAKRICELNGIVDEAALRRAGFDPRPYDLRYTGNSNYGRIPGLRTLQGSTLGLVGLGEIGRELAARARAFEMQILYFQRRPVSAADEAALGARHVSLAELMERSDAISLQLPLNDSTAGIIGSAALQRMKPGAILVDVARPALIDRAALYEALDSGRLGGFGIDVGYEEPAKPDEKLLAYPNVIYMPHTAVAARQNALADVEEMCLKLWRAISASR
ncbi:MAG TPA: D-isomer specific 2-hydroxyacid dehydrogenase family protein [Alphaproteobacteria bacterium]|nr:D-isomer specific 2-hydroxyacid dehydrogenase family protein [Alphaproteobacteria bacterium]